MSDKILQVTDASFEADVLKSDKAVVVDFWAPWCGPCRQMEPIFDELADTYESVQFTKMNVDDNMATSATYQILSIPTLLVFKGGEVVKQVVGALPKQRLTSELEPWLGSAVVSS
jgi:thioredoxin 1